MTGDKRKILKQKGVTTYTKAQISQDLYERIGYSRRMMHRIVNSVFDIISDKLSDGYDVKLAGFGNFMVRNKNERMGRDPNTGRQIMIQSRKAVSFYPSSVIKNQNKQGK